MTPPGGARLTVADAQSARRPQDLIGRYAPIEELPKRRSVVWERYHLAYLIAHLRRDAWLVLTEDELATILRVPHKRGLLKYVAERAKEIPQKFLAIRRHTKSLTPTLWLRAY